jgi:hypothetical protein
MPKAKVNGWKCEKCGHEWCLKNNDAEIVSCSKCQHREVKRD